MRTIKEILEHIDSQGMQYRFEGDTEAQIFGSSALNQYKIGTMTWVRDRETFLRDGSADEYTLVVAPEDVVGNFKNRIVSNNVRNIYFSVMDHLFTERNDMPPIGANTYISPNVKIGKDVIIGANSVLDGDIVIEDGAKIYHNVTIINKVRIGKNTIIQSGVRIGHDGYGWFLDDDGNVTMIVHRGGVDIGDDVFIGFNTGVYRGALGDTKIGDGCKIDGMCHIGHNVIMGKGVFVVAGATLYGSVTCEDNSYIATGLINDHVILGKDSFVGMGSVVMKNVEPGETVIGVPAKSMKKKER